MNLAGDLTSGSEFANQKSHWAKNEIFCVDYNGDLKIRLLHLVILFGSMLTPLS